jgi:hypothetical protein
LSPDLNRWWTMNIRGKDDPYLKIGEVNDRATKGESEYVRALRDINLRIKKYNKNILKIWINRTQKGCYNLLKK